MIAAIHEMAQNMDDTSHLLTAKYLKACNMIFETGILSHERITSSNSTPLINLEQGLSWFLNWKRELQKEPGITIYNICDNFMKYNVDIKFRSPIQKVFLSWQV